MTRSVCHSCLLREAIHCAVGVLDRVALSSTGRVTVVDEDMIAEENIWIAVAAAVDEWNHRRHHYDLSFVRPLRDLPDQKALTERGTY